MKFFSSQFVKGLWWFRICGFGLHWKNLRIHQPLFSERNGYTKCFQFGRWSFGILTPIRYKDISNEWYAPLQPIPPMPMIPEPPHVGSSSVIRDSFPSDRGVKTNPFMEVQNIKIEPEIFPLDAKRKIALG